jgi:hypothetical protein
MSLGSAEQLQNPKHRARCCGLRGRGRGSGSAAPGLDKPCWGAGRGGDARRARVNRHRVHGDGRRPRAEGDPKAYKLKVCTCVTC